MHERKVLLQHLAFESREKRLLLCSVLLEWGVNKELVLEICQSGGMDAEVTRRRSVSSLASSVVSAGSGLAVSAGDRWKHHNKNAATASRTLVRSSNQDDDDDDADHGEEGERVDSDTGNQSEYASEHDGFTRRHHHDTSASEAHVAHIQTVCSLHSCASRLSITCSLSLSLCRSHTRVCLREQIKILAERMSAMEEEQRKAQVYLNKLEVRHVQVHCALEKIERENGGKKPKSVSHRPPLTKDCWVQ